MNANRKQLINQILNNENYQLQNPRMKSVMSFLAKYSDDDLRNLIEELRHNIIVHVIR